MRIRPDLVPDVSRTHRARTFLIGCAVLVLAVFAGIVAGFFVGAWIWERIGHLEDSGTAFVGLGALWGMVGGGIASAVIGGVAARRGRSPSGVVQAPVIAWMGYWLFTSMFLIWLHECGRGMCREFDSGATRGLLVLEAVILVAASVGSFVLRSPSRRWLALGIGVVASPALFLGAVGLASVSVTPRQDSIVKSNQPPAAAPVPPGWRVARAESEPFQHLIVEPRWLTWLYVLKPPSDVRDPVREYVRTIRQMGWVVTEGRYRTDYFVGRKGDFQMRIESASTEAMMDWIWVARLRTSEFVALRFSLLSQASPYK